ncbi:hypothetical protein HYQ46_004358 [Verticillium longisporum]|nr:hypothetical protein HYQ46_004358 [Verticillium longisporum]
MSVTAATEHKERQEMTNITTKLSSQEADEKHLSLPQYSTTCQNATTPQDAPDIEADILPRQAVQPHRVISAMTSLYSLDTASF